MDNFKSQTFEKILSGQRLTEDEYERLFDISLFHDLGSIANEIAINKNGNVAYYVLNRHINPTNICINRCKFCAFSRSKGQQDAFELSIDEIIDKLISSPISFKEVHIVGGLHPDWEFEHYIKIVKTVRLQFPNVAIKAYSAVEIDHISKISGKDIDYVLKSLKDAGLDMLPGGGAEIFEPKVRERLCPEKISGERWLYIMER
ncbi:MAG: radical SAM protein, partial [Thermodesulfovibrionales bacterium]|nr:radical SAM protein [Thermodesulfovibrionales bacterium]